MNLKIKILVFIGLIFLGATGINSVKATEDTEQKNLATLNDKIKDLEDLLIQQDAITPLDATCLVKPDREPLDYYKDILIAYAPFYDQDPKKLHVTGYDSLARTLLGFIKKRALYRECLNHSEVACSPEEIDEYMGYLRRGESYSLTHIPNIYRKARVEPIIADIEDQTKRAKKEETSSIYFTAFEHEIDRRLKTGKMSYQWFMMFSDQLSVLTSQLLYRSFATVNTQYAAYFEYVDRKNDFPNFSKKKYLTSSPRINHVMSLPGLTNQFPAVFMMPYPFILEPLDFVNLVVGSNRLFWPCGMVFGPVVADGWYHCPRNFYGHDWHHLGTLLASILAPCIFGETMESILDNPSLFIDILYCSQNSLPLYCLLQKELYKSISEISDPDTKKMFSFFAFGGFHEDVMPISHRIKYILGRGSEDFESKTYYNLNYYRPLYPTSVLNLNNSDLKNYLKSMCNHYRDFCNNHISSDLKKWVNVFLNHEPNNSRNHYYTYTVNTNENVYAWLSSHNYNSFHEFVFRKVCGSSGEKLELMNLMHSPLSSKVNEIISYVRKGQDHYESLKNGGLIPDDLEESFNY